MRKYLLLPLLLLSIMLTSACAAVAEPTVAPDIEAEVGQAEAELPAPVEIRRDDDVPRITIEEAIELVDSGTAVFMDARAQESYDVQHIPGALPPPSVALSELGETLDPDLLIITYCT